MSKIHDRFKEIWLPGILIFISALWLFETGVDSARHWYFKMVTDLVTTILFGVLATVIIADIIGDIKHAVADEFFHKTEKVPKELADKIDGEAETGFDVKELAETLHQCIFSVVGEEGVVPTPVQIPVINKLFTERTGKFSKIIVVDKHNINTEIQNEPFEADKPKVTHIQVTNGDVPVRKPRMTAKRKAALEVEQAERDSRNAKRRQDRAQKKATQVKP